MVNRGFTCALALFATAVLAAPQIELADPVEVTPTAKHQDLSPDELYPRNKAEHYFSKAQLNFIRPGLNIEVESFEIPEDLMPVARLKFTDDLGQPLDRAGVVTPGSIGASFILAYYDEDRREYTAYGTRTVTSPISGMTAEQASTSSGTWTDIELGVAEFKFNAALPADFDQSKTHTLAIYARRNLADDIGKNYHEDVIYDFRPDGGEAGPAWAAVTDASCNACHQDLAAHGDNRRGVKECATCHSSQTVDPDTGNTVDFKVMIHKIHMGENLPSVQAGAPYQIIGFRQSVHDYSHVAFPQDIRACENCHDPVATAGANWLNFPTRASCGACHDNINWETGEGHAPGPQANDDACANCHAPVGEEEFDVSIVGAHTIPTRSNQLAGLNVDILNVENTAPGDTPIVTFRVYNDDGTSVDPSSLDRMRFLAAGPTTDFSQYFTQNAGSAVVDGDTAVYTFESPLPADTAGSWALSADVYRNVDIAAGDDMVSVREAAFNPYFEFAVTDAETMGRRQIVSLEKCNDCHDALALHGGQRFRTEECVMCHNPLTDDSPVRPEEAGAPESVDFKWLIHRLHKGEELERDFTVYGFRSSVHNYNELLYPGNLANCEACHVDGSHEMPLPATALETATPRDIYSPKQPTATACLSCHDSEQAASHAFVNTAPFGEACAACHGPDREFSVSKVHAQ